MRIGLALGLAVGLVLGIGGYTFIYARGYSYLTNDPESCVNCHVMQEQYSGWVTSSHRSVAVCNDCHTPHDVIGKYVTKARNGWNHSVAFTLQSFDEPIRIKSFNEAIVEENCRACHEELVNQITGHYGAEDQELDCVRCHREVGHALSG